MIALRVLERVHGHIGWLSAAALIHPAIVLRNPRRKARGAALSGALVPTLAGALGAFLYRDFGRTLKRPLFTASHVMGELFERKEHLAVAAVALAWTGFLLHVSVRSSDASSQARARGAHYAFVAAAVMTAVVSTLGTAVSSFLSF